jgi:hypothetical protein
MMELSTGFIALEEMIEKNWGVINIVELDELLKQLEEDEHITAAEHDSLLMGMAGR